MLLSNYSHPDYKLFCMILRWAIKQKHSNATKELIRGRASIEKAAMTKFEKEIFEEGLKEEAIVEAIQEGLALRLRRHSNKSFFKNRASREEKFPGLRPENVLLKHCDRSVYF